MFVRVQEVIEELKPLIQSVGIDVVVEDAIDRVVTLRLSQIDGAARPDMDRLKSFIEREVLEEIEEVGEVKFTGDVDVAAPRTAPPAPAARPALDIDVVVSEDEVDTCVFTLSQVVAPPNAALFESAEDAVAFPLIRSLFEVEGVAAVIANDRMLIVNRSPNVEWPPLVEALTERIRSHFSSGSSASEEDIRKRVQTVLDTDINPAVSMHGGVIELLDVKGTEIFVHMGGGCQGCGQAAATLKHGVHSAIQDAVPEVTAIYDTTDHAAGANPYYQASY